MIIDIRRILFTCSLVLTLSCSVVFQSTAQQKKVDDYIQKALINSPLLGDFRNQLLSNKLDSSLLRAGYRPQIIASSTGTYAPVINGYGYDNALSNGKTFDALITANQNIIGKSRKDIQLEGIKLHSDSIDAASKISQQDIRKSITEQYITTYTDQQQRDFYLEVYRLLQKEEKALKILTQKSVYKQADYLAFLVTFQQQELQLSQTNIQLKNDFSRLNYLSGIVDTNVVALEEPMLTPAALSGLSNSIFMQGYKIDSLKLLNDKKQVDLNYKPQASVYVNGGYNSSFILQPYKNFGTSVGFTVSMPIYDGGQRKMKHTQLQIQENTRQGYQQFFTQQYQQQVNQLIQQLQATQELHAKITKQIKFTEGLINVDSKLLQTGDITIADYVIAINNYLSTQYMLRQVNISRLQLINQLNYWNN
ncbi:TolC family protein [Pedobacter foliorum]|uniref:TolC family protein n=1 Tax=Pedobacter foliorum TaxID=2739058 RepID=UPI00156761B5|nr:TolC family protein [Pedobacter foliorum]NRF40797.1 TolC family protein [Pedobacter foliorum]